MTGKIFTVVIVLIFVIINVFTAKVEQGKILKDGVIIFPDQYHDNTESEHNLHHPYHQNPAFDHHHHHHHHAEKNPIPRTPESSTPEYTDTNKSKEVNILTDKIFKY